MKIDKKAVFSDIKVGDTFWVGNQLFLKIGTYYTINKNRYTAVNLENGALIDVYDNDVIVPANVVIVDE